MSDFFDFNDAGEQRTFDVIPENTIATVEMTIRPGGAGEGSWLTHAHTEKGDSDNLNCEFVIVDGPHAKRKFWIRYTVGGTGQGHADAKKISRDAFRWMLESARGIRPDDKSEAAEAARRVKGYQDLDKLRFVVRIGVLPPKDGRAAKNTIKEIITPDRHDWTKPEQVDRTLSIKPAINAAAPAPQPTSPPAGAIARPQWAQPENKQS